MMFIRGSAPGCALVAAAAHSFDFVFSPRDATLAARLVSVPGEREHMKRFTLLAAAALTAVAFGTSSLSAQDTTRKESKGEVAMPVTVVSLVTVIDATLANAAKVSAMKPESPPALELVDIQPILATEADQKIINEALDKNKDSIKQLESALKANTTIKAALDSHAAKPDADDVVAVDVKEGNKVIVYFWKR
ncbi:MAG TPA: hypothetical protein VH762_05965 [Gemmatimonadaceae bacterium]|jgi:hypothetical protein